MSTHSRSYKDVYGQHVVEMKSSDGKTVGRGTSFESKDAARAAAQADASKRNR